MSSAETSTTRELILRSCLDLLEQGKAPSMSEIAARAGKSRQAVYLHFESRTALLLAAIEQIRTDFGARDAFAAIIAEPDPDAALQRLKALHATFTPRIINANRAIDAARADDPEFDAAWLQRDHGGRRSMIRTALAKFAEAGRLAPEWTVETATDWFWALSAPSLMYDLLSAGWTADEVADMTFTVVSKSLLRPKQD